MQNDNDIMKFKDNYKCEIIVYPGQHDVSPVYGFFKCQEKSINSYLLTTYILNFTAFDSLVVSCGLFDIS